MVRIDERMPDRIDVERCDSVKGISFSLTLPEYQTIVGYLKEIAGLDERLAPPGGR